MVKLFLSGPGGCGKTTIVEALENHEEFKNFKRISEVARELMRERNLNSDDLQKYDIDQFISFQEYIIEQQCVAEERNITFENVISDRSALDCVAYVLWKTGGDFESRTFRELVSRNKVRIAEAVKRYQESMFFLVHPWSKSTTMDDGIRLFMTAYDCSTFTSIVRQLLQKFEIPFTELKEPDLEARVQLILSVLQMDNKKDNFDEKGVV